MIGWRCQISDEKVLLGADGCATAAAAWNSAKASEAFS